MKTDDGHKLIQTKKKHFFHCALWRVKTANCWFSVIGNAYNLNLILLQGQKRKLDRPFTEKVLKMAESNGSWNKWSISEHFSPMMKLPSVFDMIFLMKTTEQSSRSTQLFAPFDFSRNLFKRISWNCFPEQSGKVGPFLCSSIVFDWNDCSLKFGSWFLFISANKNVSV